MLVLRNKTESIRSLPFLRTKEGDPVRPIIDVYPEQAVDVTPEYLEKIGEKGQVEIAELVSIGVFEDVNGVLGQPVKKTGRKVKQVAPSTAVGVPDEVA